MTPPHPLPILPPESFRRTQASRYATVLGDLGVDVDAEKVIRGIEEENPDILGFSSLLTTTMPEMGAIIAALAARGLRDRVRIMVGGAPLDTAYAARIGADGYGRDAVAAVAMARRFVDR